VDKSVSLTPSTPVHQCTGRVRLHGIHKSECEIGYEMYPAKIEQTGARNM